jgi:hypothetical protein
MASTKQRSKPTSNGSAATVNTAVKDAGHTAVDAARRARGPILAVSAAAAGLAGGLAAGSRLGSKHRRRPIGRRRRVLGIPVGHKSGVVKTAELLRDGAKHLDSATSRFSGASDDVHEIREQLDRVNRQSPLEVVLDGLTHRRGAHRREG